MVIKILPYQILGQQVSVPFCSLLCLHGLTYNWHVSEVDPTFHFQRANIYISSVRVYSRMRVLWLAIKYANFPSFPFCIHMGSRGCYFVGQFSSQIDPWEKKCLLILIKTPHAWWLLKNLILENFKKSMSTWVIKSKQVAQTHNTDIIYLKVKNTYVSKS